MVLLVGVIRQFMFSLHSGRDPLFILFPYCVPLYILIIISCNNDCIISIMSESVYIVSSYLYPWHVADVRIIISLLRANRFGENTHHVFPCFDMLEFTQLILDLNSGELLPAQLSMNGVLIFAFRSSSISIMYIYV